MLSAALSRLTFSAVGPIQGYASDKDDLYNFEAPNITRYPVRLAAATKLPDIAGPVSALLKVRVRAKAVFGKPFLQMNQQDGVEVRYHFDRAASGIRYLDVSMFGSSGSRELFITTSGLTVEDSAELIAFPAPVINGPVLVLAPHPDDAEIAAYALYKQNDSAVVTVTAGDSGGANYRHFYSDAHRMYDLKRKVRLWDSLSIPMLAGVRPERLANLGYFDETLQAMQAAPTRNFTGRMTGDNSMQRQRASHGSQLLRPNAVPNWQSLVEDFAYLLKVLSPSVVVAPHPLLDAHPDHRFTSFALFEAIARERCEAGHLFLYSNHPVYCSKWPFGPAGTGMTLPPWPKTAARLWGFYSQPLSRDDQIEKMFALEAMHDLRRAPPGLDGKLWGALAPLLEARDAFLRHKVGPYSYFRRAVRSSETFFIYPMAAAESLRDGLIDAPAKW